MHLIEYVIAASLWADLLARVDHQSATNTNEMLLQHLPEYDEESQILPLAKIFPMLFQVQTLW